MKKANKLIQKIKNNIPGFVTGILMCSMVGVAATTVFPSNSVTYSNTLSGLKATDVQGAIDELYNTCFPPKTSSEIIIENASLKKDQYECRYFFTGADPNNYITFNNEMWRIISIECNGTIKIMRDESIGNQYWDSSGNNDWERPATLNTYLNETYYNNLNSASRNQIVASSFSIGSIEFNEINIKDQISKENSKTWNGKIALPTVSEYIRTNSNSSCTTFRLYQANYFSCKDTAWMFNGADWWTITSASFNTNTAYNLTSYGSIGNYYVTAGNDSPSAGVRPTLYLSSNLNISGNGTSSDPYRIEY